MGLSAACLGKRTSAPAVPSGWMAPGAGRKPSATAWVGRANFLDRQRIKGPIARYRSASSADLHVDPGCHPIAKLGEDRPSGIPDGPDPHSERDKQFAIVVIGT